MITRKILRLTTLVLFLAISLPAISSNVSAEPGTVPKTEEPKAQQLLLRLDQIKAMDKTELSGTEKKNLRKEVKEIKKELKVISGGVYLSVGAVIIIILLLILLL